MKNICYAVVFFIVISSFYFVGQAGEITQIPTLTPVPYITPIKEEIPQTVITIIEKDNVLVVIISLVTAILGVLIHFLEYKIKLLELSEKAGTKTKKKINKNRNTKSGSKSTRLRLILHKYFFIKRVLNEEVFY